MAPVAIGLLALTMSLAGCGPANDGFRFDGEYVAARSGYSLRLLSEGYPAPGGGEAFALVQVCPVSSDGNPLRMAFTASGDGGVMLESAGLGPVAVPWDSATSEGTLRGLLISSGFRRIDPAELAASISAVDRALGGTAPGASTQANGVLRTVREDLTRDHPIDHDKPPAEWVAPADLAGCR